MRLNTPIARTTAGIAFLVLLANLCVAAYVRSERAVYVWDHANYWNQFIHYTRLLRTAPLDALRELIGTIRYAEYNGIPAMLLTPVGLLAGTSRLSYILGVANLFALPAVAAAVWAVISMGGSRREAASAMLALALPCAALWNPVLRGFETIGGLIPAFLLLGLAARRGPAAWGLRDILLAGCCLGGLVLFRRIYAYWAAGYVLALALVDLTPGFFRQDSRATALAAAGRLALAGALAAILVFGLAAPMALSMIRNDYAALYGIYRVSADPTYHLLTARLHFGWPLLLLALAGFARGVCRPEQRRWALLLGVQLVVVFVWFTRVQDFHRHHFYNLLPGLLGLAWLALRTPRAPRGLVPSIAALGAAGCAMAFSPTVTFALPDPLIQALSPARAHPLRRDDLAEVRRLLRTLDSLPDAADPRRGVYVLASSDTLNDEFLRAARTQLDTGDGAAVIRATANKTDRKFGFPRDLLAAAYLVVADPVQVHLAGAQSQPTIRGPHAALGDAKGFGSAYEPLPDAFTLDGGVHVRLLQRREPSLRPAQRESLAAACQALAPGELGADRFSSFLEPSP